MKPSLIVLIYDRKMIRPPFFHHFFRAIRSQTFFRFGGRILQDQSPVVLKFKFWKFLIDHIMGPHGVYFSWFFWIRRRIFDFLCDWFQKISVFSGDFDSFIKNFGERNTLIFKEKGGKKAARSKCRNLKIEILKILDRL